MSESTFSSQDLHSPVEFEMLLEIKPFKSHPVRWWQKALGGKLLCQPSVEQNSTKLLVFALLCEGESLKPVCNLLSSLGGPY